MVGIKRHVPFHSRRSLLMFLMAEEFCAIKLNCTKAERKTWHFFHRSQRSSYTLCIHTLKALPSYIIISINYHDHHQRYMIKKHETIHTKLSDLPPSLCHFLQKSTVIFIKLGIFSLTFFQTLSSFAFNRKWTGNYLLHILVWLS